MVKIYIETRGCSHNSADTEHMASLLQKAGHKLVKKENSADLILFNTCTVKTPTEHAFFNRLKQVEKDKKKIVIAGCIPQTDPEKLKNHSIVGTFQLDRITKAVNSTLSGEKVSFIQKSPLPELSINTILADQVIEIIPINLGCLGNCSYCKTKAARGDLHSYPIKEIIKKARHALNNGVKEIWLTSQDAAAYGKDIKTNVVDLISELCKINKDFKIRLGMGNPNNFLPVIDQLIKVMKKENKLYKFLHLPLQSGNDEVLKKMNRHYTVKKFKCLINKIRKEIPNITIATDIICGFPGETKKTI